MKIKHWDEASQSWVIDGASNAANLELSNPGYVDAEGNSVSIDHGFTKVDNRLTKLEQNLAWIYLNGAKGGEGGGGGGTDVTFTLTVAEGSTVYTATSSTTLNVTINSGTVKKSFTLTAKNLSTNAIIGTWKIYSLTRTPITLTGLSGSTEIELSAYDSSNNYTSPAYVNVVAGAISLGIQSIPPKTIYIGGVASVNANFTVTNNIVGSAAAFKLMCNGIEVASETGITTTIRSLSYDLRAIIFDSGLFTPSVGIRYTFTASASTILNTATITSNVITFDLTVADSNNLIIVTDDISDFVPSVTPGQTYDDLSEYSQGSQLGFTYYLSYARTIHSSFNIDYTIYSVNGAVETELDSGRISNVVKGVDNRFVYSTVNLSVSQPGEYLKIKLYGSAVNDPLDISAQYTKYVYCVITEAVQVDLFANNDQETLLAYFSKVSGFPNTSTGTWTYMPAISGPFKYSGAFKNSFPQGVKLTLNDVNGVTSGFIVDTDGINDIPGTVLKGGSYAYLQVAEHMFPQVDIQSGESFFQPVGFHLSTTFKAEESSDADEVILSMGKYTNGVLNSGIEITLEQVYVKIGSADSIVCKLPQNELLTVDLDVSYVSGAWYFKIYLNGVLSAVSRVLTSDIDWQFETDLYLGCRYEGNPIIGGVRNTGTKSRFSNVTIYDLKLYTSSQTDFAIVQNYISATEQASLILGAINPTLDADLRSKNLFDSAGNCLIWDRAADGGRGAFLEGNALYQAFYDQVGVSTPYPLVLIEETSAATTLFEAYSTAVFSASEKETIMSAQFPVKVTYIDTTGRADIITPTGVNSANGVRIGLQGTSSLSYNAKNFELYMGDKDEAGNKLLFRPKQDWLPENEFTLKADVMDSAHVNNVVVGKIINGTVSETLSSPFADTPPMLLPTNEVPAEIRDKIKHTSEGFPCLVFIRFAPDAQGNVQQIKFAGIYNFNLGRYAYYNLGLKILNSFTPEKVDGPTLVTEYTETTNRWNTGIGEGVYSLEINQNSSAQGAFQQDDLQIIKFMGDVVYTSRDEDAGYTKAQRFYNQMANMALTKIPKYTMDDAGQTPTKPISSVPAVEWVSGTAYALNTYVYDSNLIYYKSLVSNNTQPLPQTTNTYWEVAGELGYYYNLDKNAYYNFAASDAYLSWQNACAYFVIGIVFGMVDSMCKNLTLRNWGSDVWYPSFYDMDTAFGLNNAGQDVVAYYAHLHRWYNIRTSDTGLSTYTQEKNYISNEIVKQYYASWWNRIWEVLENLPITDSGNIGNRTSIEETYINLRTNLFPDPEQFIEDNYKSYTDTTGSLIFNYDYRIKYLKIAQTYDVNTGEYTDSTDFSQLKFLHGNRVMHVKDWFKKRILFLDGVYGINANTVTLPTNIESPVTSLWAANKATGSPLGTKFGVTMSASSKVLYHYSHDSTWGSFWLSESPEVAVVPIPAGETVIYMYANKYITQFENFKGYPWTGLNNINLPLLEELDLTGLSNMPANDFFFGGVLSATGVGLKNIKKLILKNVVLTGPNASAYTLDVSRCSKLEYLDISNSSITNVTLPTTAVLKTYDLSGTAITNLTLSNQAFLENLILTNCDSLTSITIENCGKLSSLNIPKNVTSVTIRNCPTLQSISIPYTSINNSISSLNRVSIDNCPGLKSFSIVGQNNPALVVELAGAWNLETLNVSGTSITSNNLTLASSEIWTTLKSLNISRTDLSTLKFTNQTYDYLNLSMFPDLDDIVATDCSNLVKVVCTNNPLNPINLQTSAFANCSALTRVIGHYNLKGADIFKGCSNLILNDEDLYLSQGTNQFLVDEGLLQATNISIDPTISSLMSCFESCSSLTYDDFKLVFPKIGTNITSIEALFKGCIKIDGAIWYDLFRNCPNLTIIKEAFSGVQLSGPFYSRTLDYVYGNTSTYGILDFLPNLLDAEGAFEGTDLTWIDNRVFAPRLVSGVLTYSPIVKVDRMFRNCMNLKSCENTRAVPIVAGNLNSEDFFLNLRNLIAMYPKEVFAGCQNIKMTVAEDSAGNTLLFHLINEPSGNVVLTNSLYTGIQLIGEIKQNVFGGITKTLVGNSTYYLPNFTSIQFPFNTMGLSFNSQLTVVLSGMGSMFRGIGSTLLQAIGIFTGVKCATNDSIPPDLFKGCSALNSIESCFANSNVNNNGLSYDFPPVYDDGGVTKGMFDDCVSLRTTVGLFSNCYDLKIKLVGEGFKNTQLVNVSRMFENSGLYGTIPYRLFFMRIDNGNGTYTLRKTITDMSNIFNGCWCLGYDINRKVDLGTQITSVPYRETMWFDRIIEVEGTPVSFRLDVSAMKKTYNFETGATTFDNWYLDGYGWAGATAENPADQGELDALKASLNTPYFNYDTSQATAISQHLQNGRYVDSNQNYMIPTDLFRYCNKACTLINTLQGLTWQKQILVLNDETGDYSVQIAEDESGNKIYEGLKGRIPVRLFESLTETTKMTDVFRNTRFDAFVGLQGTTFTRGIMYPPDLFKYNVALTDITGMFMGTRIPVGVDVNTDLFATLVELRVVSNVWSDCIFDNRPYNAESFTPDQLIYSQMNFANLFDTNTKLTNASGLFAVYTTGRGLYIIESTLLNKAFNLNNISNMFYYNANMKGAVPTFTAATYPVLNNVSGYLTGCIEGNITNSATLETRLIPSDWL